VAALPLMTRQVAGAVDFADIEPKQMSTGLEKMSAMLSGKMTSLVDQQIGTDLLTETHPPTPSDLIVWIDRVEGMLSDTIKVCERVKRSCRTSSSSSMPLGLRNAAHVASRYMKRKIQVESGPKIQDRGSHRSHLDEPCPIHENPKHTTR
jgi:hypothetical protein